MSTLTNFAYLDFLGDKYLVSKLPVIVSIKKKKKKNFLTGIISLNRSFVIPNNRLLLGS